jgi:hypothetical protein
MGNYSDRCAVLPQCDRATDGVHRTNLVQQTLRRLLFVLVILPLAAAGLPQLQYLEFSDDYVEIADDDSIDLTGGAFTLSAWIRPTDWGENSQGRILDHGGGSSGDGGWTLQLENKSSLGYPQALRMRIKASSSHSYYSDTASIQLDSWQHVAVTYDGDALRLYVNGVVAGEHFGVPAPFARDSVLRIGASAIDEQRFFAGAIDEVRIWSQALDQATIASRMNAELAGDEPGLVVYYRFNGPDLAPYSWSRSKVVKSQMRRSEPCQGNDSAQKPASLSSRYCISSGVFSRPKIVFRCGNLPNLSIIAKWLRAYSSVP